MKSFSNVIAPRLWPRLGEDIVVDTQEVDNSEDVICGRRRLLEINHSLFPRLREDLKRACVSAKIRATGLQKRCNVAVYRQKDATKHVDMLQASHPHISDLQLPLVSPFHGLVRDLECNLGRATIPCYLPRRRITDSAMLDPYAELLLSIVRVDDPALYGETNPGLNAWEEPKVAVKAAPCHRRREIESFKDLQMRRFRVLQNTEDVVVSNVDDVVVPEQSSQHRSLRISSVEHTVPISWYSDVMSAIKDDEPGAPKRCREGIHAASAVYLVSAPLQM
ncbi:hypothetical protein FB451DRAFT_1423490 [Mycena latifolia]|nr:hypothetical protein FB451DRAFT_1423490 [Mycena latifolia]